MSLDAIVPWIPCAVALVAAVAAGLAARSLVVRRLAAVFAKTGTDLDDLVLAALRPQLAVWCVLAGVALAAQFAPVTPQTQASVQRLVKIALVGTLTFAGASFLGRLVERSSRRAQGSATATSLTRNVVRTAVMVVGGLLVLDNLGIEIAPLLTALGIGSLAVALALQPTLSNLFAGLHIAISRPVRVGDFVELDNGSQGFVEDIGWRATRVRELQNDIVVVPNARLVEMVVKNFALPDPEQAVVVQVGVAYGSDLEHVERVTVEVAREVQRCVSGAVESFEPFVRYHTFGDSSIGFSVILRARQFTDRYLMVHELLKRLKARYDREGIEIPFPQRVLHGALDARFGRLPRASAAASPAVGGAG